MLAWTHLLECEQSARNLADLGTGRALLNTIATLQAIIRRTHYRQQQSSAELQAIVDIDAALEAFTSREDDDISTYEGKERQRERMELELKKKTLRAKLAELCLIQSRDDILAPPIDGIMVDSWNVNC